MIGNTADDETNGETNMLQMIVDAWVATRLREKAERIAADQTRIIDMGWEGYLCRNDPGEVPFITSAHFARDGEFSR